MLYQNDQYLILSQGENYVSERSITFNLGQYLKAFIQDVYGAEYNVDCEFNRDLDTIKRIGIDKIIPDIIIHKRGSNENNLVVIEVKPWWNLKEDALIADEDKLKYLTNNSYQYKYDYGLSLIINKNRTDSEVKIFIDGNTDNVYYKI